MATENDVQKTIEDGLGLSKDARKTLGSLVHSVIKNPNLDVHVNAIGKDDKVKDRLEILKRQMADAANKSEVVPNAGLKAATAGAEEAEAAAAGAAGAPPAQLEAQKLTDANTIVDEIRARSVEAANEAAKEAATEEAKRAAADVVGMLRKAEDLVKAMKTVVDNAAEAREGVAIADRLGGKHADEDNAIRYNEEEARRLEIELKTLRTEALRGGRNRRTKKTNYYRKRRRSRRGRSRRRRSRSRRRRSRRN